MVVVVRQGFGELVPIATRYPRHSAHHAGVDEFGQVAVRRALRHPRPFHHLLGRERSVAVLERCEYCTPVRCESLFTHRQHLQHSGRCGRGQHRRLWSTRAHVVRLPLIPIEWEWFLLY
jgi:hypothetical protein